MNHKIANLIADKPCIPEVFQKFEIPLLIIVIVANFYLLLWLLFQ